MIILRETRCADRIVLVWPVTRRTQTVPSMPMSAALTTSTFPCPGAPCRCGAAELARRPVRQDTVRSGVCQRSPCKRLSSRTHQQRMHHLLMALPAFPDLAKVERRYPFVPHDLLLHFTDLVDAHIGEEVGKLFLRRIVGVTSVPPIVCGNGRVSRVEARRWPPHSQLAPPTGPTRCSLRIQIGVSGHVFFTCRSRCRIRRCHHSTRSCVSGISVERCLTRSWRPKNARSHTKELNVSADARSTNDDRALLRSRPE